MNSLLISDETIIREFRARYRQHNGKLILTSRRLIFLPGLINFPRIDKLEIPLVEIDGVQEANAIGLRGIKVRTSKLGVSMFFIYESLPFWPFTLLESARDDAVATLTALLQVDVENGKSPGSVPALITPLNSSASPIRAIVLLAATLWLIAVIAFLMTNQSVITLASVTVLTCVCVATSIVLWMRRATRS